MRELQNINERHDYYYSKRLLSCRSYRMQQKKKCQKANRICKAWSVAEDERYYLEMLQSADTEENGLKELQQLM